MEQENPIDKKVNEVKTILTTSKTVISSLKVLGFIGVAISMLCIGFAVNGVYGEGDDKTVFTIIFVGLLAASVIVIAYANRKSNPTK